MTSGINPCLNLPAFFLAVGLWVVSTCTQVHAATVSSDSVLVANGGRIYEYSRTGAFVQQVSGDLRNGVFSESRGLAVDDQGRIHVLIRPHDVAQGMFLATYTLSTNTTTYNSIAGHFHNGNTTFGDIAANAKYVYAPDEFFSGQDQGIIRYPLNNLSAPQRLLTDLDFTDVAVGHDGLLYGLFSNGGNVSVIDPSTMTILRTLDTPNNLHDAVVRQDGHIFTLHSDRILRHYTPQGTLVKQLTLSSSAFASMDLASDGTIVVGSSGSTLTFTTTALDSFTAVNTPNSTERTWGNFVTFATPVPEPTGIGLFLSSVFVLQITSRRRSKSPRVLPTAPLR